MRASGAERTRTTRARRRALAGLLCGALVAADAAATDAPPIPRVHAPAGAPHIVIVLLDDVGFGATGTFGGPTATPSLDALAARGLRYNRFHTTAICSPTRASLLTGRDPHAANVGAVLNSANAHPGYQGILRKETATIARLLRDHGYATAAFGKWHLAPAWETSQAGPFDRWPTGVGFEKFYGFLGGETDQFAPTLYEGTTPVPRPARADYHLTEDLADRAIAWMRAERALAPDRPFFLYFATGATHAPLQVPKAWIERQAGRFAQGWDVMREEIFARQKALGVIPPDALLTPRPAELPAWSSLDEGERVVAERLMETYAAFLEHTDAQVGRLVAHLEESGELDDTLFLWVVGDNGGSAEGGLLGSINYMGALQGLGESTERKLERLDAIGSADSYPQYPAAWAWSLSTPFQWVKQVASHFGGTRNPLVVSWPKGIADRGGLRSQFAHVNDVVPTILDVLGIAPPASVDGVAQLPFDGHSLVPSFASADAPEHHPSQYFEVHGHRAYYHEGWIASARHARLPWSVGLPQGPLPMEDDRWELYDVAADFSQARDLASERPEKLAELRALFEARMRALGVWPVRSSLEVRTPMPTVAQGRTRLRFHAGMVGTPEQGVPIANRSWKLRASLALDAPGEGRGVIATLGGTAGGFSLYLDEAGRPVFEYRVFELAHVTLAGDAPLPAGRSQLDVEFRYDGGGPAKGGELVLSVGDAVIGRARVPATPPSYFSIDETFDVGVDTGSPAGAYPPAAGVGFPLEGARLEHVDVELL
ncbi:MAG: arylsulfatase [Myxococcales bacterium]|nr:arylsulfatase [Myxococcales bacterium]